jgi:galactokinase/mevalonate kinase-like predicted kinase
MSDPEPRRLEASAPARANLIGNPSDLYGGAVLGCSVPLRARVRLEASAATELRAGGERLPVASERDLELRGDRFDVARAVLRSLEWPGRGEPLACSIAFETEIPLRSGLAGSTALLVALLGGLLAWRGESPAPTPTALAKRARAVEREILGVTCGWTDFYLCSFGGLQYMQFRGLEIERPSSEAPDASLEPLVAPAGGLPFRLAFTGVRHDSGAVHRPIRERWEAGEPAVVAAYARIAEIASEGRAAFLEAAWARLGALMNENHALRRDLGGSGESNERLIAAALAAGAPGAKLAGAGQGGTIAALWPQPDAAPLVAALRAAGAEAIYRPEVVPGLRVRRDNGEAG